MEVHNAPVVMQYYLLRKTVHRYLLRYRLSSDLAGPNWSMQIVASNGNAETLMHIISPLCRPNHVTMYNNGISLVLDCVLLTPAAQLFRVYLSL